MGGLLGWWTRRCLLGSGWSGHWQNAVGGGVAATSTRTLDPRAPVTHQPPPPPPPQVAAKYLEEAEGGAYHFRPQWASEAAIAAIAPRPDSPEWLVGAQPAHSR